MGTIIYTNRNRIVELENEDEIRDEHIGMMVCFSLLLIGITAFVIRASIFTEIGPIAQTFLLGNTVMMMLTLCWSAKGKEYESEVKTFFLTGLALTVPVLMAI